jgi:hypothetical protein
MSIGRELKFAERVARSGRDLEDQDVAEFESKKLQSLKRLVLFSFEDGASLAMKMGEESNSKQPNPNTMPVPKTVGVTMARAGGWWSFAAP